MQKHESGKMDTIQDVTTYRYPPSSIFLCACVYVCVCCSLKLTSLSLD